MSIQSTRLKGVSSLALCGLATISLSSGCGSQIVSTGGDSTTKAPETSTTWSGSKLLGIAGAFGTAGTGISLDSTGNLFIGGTTEGALDGQIKSSDGTTRDSFITKYSALGAKLWTRQMGVSGTNETIVYGVTTDSSGNAIVAGHTQGSIDGQTKTSNATYYDFFVAKYSTAGTKIWTRQLGAAGNMHTYGYDVATDSSGNVFVTGLTTGALDGQSKTSNATYNDFFLTKYNSSGTKLWTRQLGVTGNFITNSNGVTTDSSGNIYIGGYTSGALDSQTKISSATYHDYFITKYDTSGTKLWTRQSGVSGNFTTIAYRLATDSSQNVFLAGYTTGAIDGQTKTSNSGRNDFFLVKYSSSGVRSWTRQLGAPGENDTVGYAVKTDSEQNVLIAHYTYGALDGQTKTSNVTYRDAFVVKYANSGARLWTAQLGALGNSNTTAAGIGTDSSDNVYIVGPTFGSVGGQPKISDSTSADTFIAKFSSLGTLQ